ncbi:MAG: phosphoglucosamine mutase [Clostridia bacterium]|nr:phosphoglucosamine mutase [Clostridia bacterium]
MNTVKFGTDGIRAVVNEDLTVETAYKLGCALALYLLEEEGKPIVYIGEDTRKSCAMLKSGLLAGLLSYGIDCVCLGIITTPSLAYITKKNKANAGIMITASHNAEQYNGFKVFDSSGQKIDIKTALVLERYAQIISHFKPKVAKEVGTLKNDNSKIKNYLSHLRHKIKENKFKVCFDCANGTTNFIIGKIFNPNQIVSGNEVESSLVNLNCGATDLKKLQIKVVQEGYDVGFAFDGDGDRVMAVSKSGRVVDGDEILYIIAKYLKMQGKLKRSTVVGTVVTNYGVEKSLSNIGINLVRQQVGDKFINLEMKRKGYNLGGEQSGHIIIGNETTTGDGVLVAITLLNIMNELNADLEDLTKEIIKFNQSAINVEIKQENKDYIMQNYDFNEFLSRLEDEMSYNGRILVRASGTESLIRVLVEGESKSMCESVAKQIEKRILTLNEN